MTARRQLLQAGLASGAGLLLGGCGRGAGNDAVQLSLWANLPSEQAALFDAIAEFGRQTGITVRAQVITDKYMDVMRSRFAARKPPDVFYLDSHEAPAFIRAGVLEPWDGQLEQPEDFPPQFLDAFRGADGKLYGLPKDFSTLALYINTQMLEDAGFAPADVPFITREMPRVNGQRHTMAFVAGWAVAKQSRRKEAAFRFAQYMNGPRLAAWSRASGTLPTRLSVQSQMQLEQDPVLRPHVIGARYATVWSRGIGLPVVDANFANQFVAALNGSVPMPEALRRAEAAANREIARAR